MAEDNKDGNAETASKTRRDFVKTSAQVAVTAPAVALLLNATAKPASAQVSVYEATLSHILDDFTFGNNEEDIDGGPSQDDIT
jgi:hypothetical protein